MRFRYALLLLPLLPLIPVQAQVACVDGGAVDPADGQFYPCDGTRFLSRLSLLALGVPVNPSTSLPYRGNDIWGWHDAASGREYALVGNRSGTYIADVTVPTLPAPLGRLPTATASTTWRDIKTYANTAYVVADNAGTHGIQVFDLTRLRGLEADPSRVFTADAVVTDIASAHNLFVNEATGFLYAVGGSTCAGGPVFFDLTDPLAPALAGCYDGDGYTHDLECVVYAGPDPDHQGREVCLLSNEDALTILDVTDKAAPTLIAQGFYPSAAYVHQGGFGKNQRYWYQDDEADELQGLTVQTRTIRFDLADLDAPTYFDDFLHATQSTDHNLYTVGDYIYLSNNTSGLRVLEVDPTDASLSALGFFDTHPESDAAGFEGAWSVYPYLPSGRLLVSDRARGLFVLDPFDGTVVRTEPLAASGGLEVRVSGPHPFRTATRLTLAVGAPRTVEVTLFDARGRRVQTLFAGALGPDVPHTVRVDGTGLPPGTYFARVVSAEGTATLPLVRVR